MSEKELFGLVAIGIGGTASVNYIVSILRGKTKPHAFTWIIWSLIMGVIFTAQLKAGAGAGAWSQGMDGLFCFIIFVLSLFKGEKNITTSDWVALVSALAIIPIWHYTQNAFWAVVLGTLIDGFAYYPTIRKTWIKPYEENMFMYASDNVKRVFTLLAMGDFSATTLLYPIFCMIINTSLSIMIFWRRRLQ